MEKLGELAEAPVECSCIEEVNADLAPRNARLVISVVFDRAKPALRSVPTIEVEKIETRRRMSTAVIPTFCPFCGIRYRPEASSAEPQE